MSFFYKIMIYDYSQGKVGTMSTQCSAPCLVRSGSSVGRMSTSTSKCLAWARNVSVWPYTTGIMSWSTRSSAKALRMHSEPTPWGSPHVMPMRTYTHTYIHTYTDRYIHTHIHTYIHTDIHTYIHE